MRKLLILPVIMAFCVADSGAFAAAPRGRTNNATNASTGVKAARAAKQQGTVKTTGGVAVRAAKTTGVTTTGVKKASPAKSTGAGSSTKTARAAATQKVLNMGTKVKTATENTVVDEECQNAYYGCMDAFCMLDNASGGRCQCSDRNKELDVVLEEIMKLDQQTLAMATEGVERIQMGENADEIMARVKAATGGIEGSDTGIDIKGGKKSSSGGVSKARTLDLTAWKNNDLFAEDDDIFGDDSAAEGVAAGGEFANKFGDELQVAASGVCVKQLPAQCKNSASFLQLTYGQRIRSDCTAYENSLKQQRNASQEKLATAQKALRDAALESFQNENKYDLGECVVRFKQCLQTTAECGEDYSGCVADTSILEGLYGKKTSKPATTVIKTGATSITISSATYDILNTKKMMCTSVVKQCVKANQKDAVWQQVIKDLAPVMYTAEYNAASNNRMNCISTVVKCVQTACGSKWDDKSDNFDACLSDPNSIENYCKLEYNRCGDVASQGNVKDYIMAKLAALKVDKCTTDVRECLLSEDRCGPDYAGCIGLDTDTIVDMCPADKLLSCQDRANGGVAAVRNYISQIAQGIALNIDNKFATACQNAVDAAMERICGSGDEDSESSHGCAGMDVLSTNEIKGSMKWRYCKEVVGTNGNVSNECTDYLEEIKDEDLVTFANDSTATPSSYGKVLPVLKNSFSLISRIKFDEEGHCNPSTATDQNSSETDKAAGEDYFCVEGVTSPSGVMKNLLKSMNREYASTMAKFKNDTTIKGCVEGKTIQGISTRASNDKNKSNAKEFGRSEGRYPQLLNSTGYEVSSEVMNTVLTDYYAELNKAMDSEDSKKMYEEISQRRQKLIVNRLSRLLMGGKNFCSLSDKDFSTLMSSPEAQKILANEQDEANRTECAGSNYNYDANFSVSGFIGSGLRSLFGTVNEYKDKLITSGSSSTYDPDTNECIVTIKVYNCEKTRVVNRRTCKRWDTKNPTVETKKIKMKEWNDKGSEFLKKSSC